MSDTHSETWEIDITVPVPAEQSVNATFLILENEYEANWKSDLLFTGCISFSFPFISKADFSVYSVFKDDPLFNCWENKSESDVCKNSFCKFEVKGTFSGVGGAQSFLETQ